MYTQCTEKSLHVAIVWPYIMSIHVNTMVGGSDKSIQYGPRKMQKDAIYQYHYVFESEIESAITFCICLGLPLSIFWDSITHMHIIVHSLEPKWPLFLSANPSIFLGSIWVNTLFYILYICPHYTIISSYHHISPYTSIATSSFPCFPRCSPSRELPEGPGLRLGVTAGGSGTGQWGRGLHLRGGGFQDDHFGEAFNGGFHMI